MRPFTIGLALFIACEICVGDSSDKELTRMMAGAWRSPRHDYVYLADGTWWMGRPEPNGPAPQATHGKWWIKDHRLCETVYVEGEGLQDNGCEIITRLTKHEIEYGSYRMKRIKQSEVDKY